VGRRGRYVLTVYLIGALLGSIFGWMFIYRTTTDSTPFWTKAACIPAGIVVGLLWPIWMLWCIYVFIYNWVTE
jgi:hypothetical protein